MADTPLTEQVAASPPPACAHTAEEPECVETDPQALEQLPATYGLLVNDPTRTDTPRSNMVGLEAQFAGGTVQISAEARARSVTAPDATDRAAPPPDETNTSDNDSSDAEAEPSPNGDDVTPDLGERVL